MKQHPMRPASIYRRQTCNEYYHQIVRYYGKLLRAQKRKKDKA